MEKKSLTVPTAIVIAGIIIAGAVLFSNTNRPTTASPATNPNQGTPTSITQTDIPIQPVSIDEHYTGDPAAPVVIVEFSDTECPFCKVFHVSMNRLMDTLGKSGKVAWVYRHFPLWKEENGVPALHSRAGKEAEALECAAKLGGNTKFWEYTNRLYATTPSNNQLDPKRLPEFARDLGLDEKAFTSCLESGEFAAVVEADYQEAKAAGANGTPFSVIYVRTPFDQKKVSDKIIELTIKYKSSGQFFALDPDNQHIGMIGAQPLELITDLVNFLQP